MNIVPGKLVVLVVVMIMASQSFAGTPPRFYLKSLAGGNAVPAIALSMSGNINPLHTNMVIEGSSFEAEVTLAGYAKSLILFDQSALLAVLVPMGRAIVAGIIDELGIGPRSASPRRVKDVEIDSSGVVV